MGTVTWISGGTKNWSDGTAWLLGAAPTAADDVVFPALSTGTLTIDGTSGTPNLCRSVNFTNFGGTLTHAAAKQLNIGDGTVGHLTFVSGMTYAPAATSIIKFVSTTTGNQITSAAKRVGSYIFDGVGGGWTYQDDQNFVGAATTTLTNGSLDTNGKAIAATSGTVFSSSNSNTRSLTLGASNYKLTTGTAAWDIGTSTGMTLSAASSTITFINTGSSPTFNGGGLTYGTLSVTGLTTGFVTITGANTFGTLTLSVTTTAKNTTTGFALSANQTVTGTFTANGSSTLLRNFIYSSTLGTPYTITAATVSVTHTDFRDITGAGAGSWDFSGLTTTANGDCGGNSGITFTTPKNCYLKVNANANWSAANWFTTSGGSTAIVPQYPLAHDTAFIDANTGFTVSRTITLDEPRMPAFNWTGAPNTPEFVTGSAFEVYGSVVYISGMTLTGAGSQTLKGRGSYTFDGGTLTPPSGQFIKFDSGNGTYTLIRNTNYSAGGLSAVSGTLDMAGFNITGSGNTFLMQGGTLKLSGTVTYGTLTFASGTVDLGSYTKMLMTGTTLAVTGSPAGGSSGTGGLQHLDSGFIRG